MTDKANEIVDRRGRFVRIFHNPITARVVLVLALCLTASAWFFSHTIVENAREDRFEFRTREIETAIHDRMIVYEQVLWGGVGLFNATDSVSRDGWAEYVATLEIDNHWPGIQGLGYSIPLAAGEVDAHVAQIRSEGFPDYAIAPSEPRDEYSSIIYLEPFDVRNQRAFGFDMWSNEMRRQAMTRARDTGLAATSGVITLVQETEEDVQQGFLTYVPVYGGNRHPTTIEERQATFEGWVYAPFRIADLMTGILGSDVNDVAYEIFDGDVSTDTLLYDSDTTFSGDELADGSDFQRLTTFEIQGRSWTIAFQSADSFSSSAESAQPTIIAIAGLIIDILLFYVITSLGYLNKRANNLAEEMTSELRQAKDDLEERSDLLEEQAKHLQRSNAELGQFAFIASHDLQEPLRNLKSYSTLLTEKYDGKLGDEGNRWLGYIGTASERMSDLIRELLDYSKIDSQLRELSPVALREVVEHAVANLEQEIIESEVTIEVGELPTVDGDSLQLERLFQNLIANAAKYRSEQAPHVEIFASDEGDAHRISVRDNGIGIKPDYQQRIFEIFRRVGSQTEHPGAGIGLAVCSKVVDAHGGTIGVESVVGEGSTFWFTIPHNTNSGQLPSPYVESGSTVRAGS